MKISLTALTILLFVAGLKAQTENLKHFEIGAYVNFWTPASMHLKTSNSVTQDAYPDGTYLSAGTLSGFGTSYSPGLQLGYFFNKSTGITLGFTLMNMDNELSVQETDSTFSSYENLAQITHLSLGVSGRYLTSESLHLFYEAGIVFIPNYDLSMHYSSESSSPPDMEAIGQALGLYCKTGMNIRIISFLSFRAALEYSFIPVELEYTNGEGSAKINEKTNLGGIGIEAGLSFDF